VNIPEEAIDAAAEFLFIDYSVTPYYREQLRAALCAAAPHIADEAWSRGLAAGIKCERGQIIANPYLNAAS